jgi:crotonobetainyl-CoA:carnitine CoA-transferase CaiB-like acyl-CoA transferase
MTPSTESVPAIPLPMAGLRVLDFTMMMAGPYCTRLMADLGAEVIKVEAPDGDPMRKGSPLRDGCSAYFGHLNAGKRSIVLDLKTEAGKRAALDLARHADVAMESFRPGVMHRIGLDYEALRAANPSLVYGSISGFGQEGPYAGRPAFAPIVHASSGLDLAIMGHQEADAPPPTGIFTADVLAGVFALVAVQGALAVRQATGKGQHIDATLFESMFNLMPYEVQEAQFPQPPRPIYRPLRAADGFLMLMVVTEANFEHVCAAIGRPDLQTDPRFDHSGARAANREALMREVEAWTRSRTVSECDEHFSRQGVPCGPYRSVRENLQNRQLLARGSFATVRDAAGSFLVPTLPFLMGGQRPSVGGRVPSLGEHTTAVLREFAGYSEEQLRATQGHRG